MTRPSGAAAPIGAARAGGRASAVESSGCCSALLLKLLKLWGDDSDVRSSAAPSRERYDAPALAPPSSLAATRPTRLLIQEEASTELLLPKDDDAVQQQREAQQATDQGQATTAAAALGPAAEAAQGSPVALLPAGAVLPGACGPLGLGTPVQGPAQEATAAGGGGGGGGGAVRIGSVTGKALHHQHRRTPSGCDHTMAALRAASRTSQHLPGRHCKKPSLTRSELSKLVLGVNPVNASLAAVLASVCQHDMDSDDDSWFCSTCLEPYTTDNPKTVTACGHHYHLPCLYAWMERKSTCPWCESTLVFEGM